MLQAAELLAPAALGLLGDLRFLAGSRGPVNAINSIRGLDAGRGEQ